MLLTNMIVSRIRERAASLLSDRLVPLLRRNWEVLAVSAVTVMIFYVLWAIIGG